MTTGKKSRTVRNIASPRRAFRKTQKGKEAKIESLKKSNATLVAAAEEIARDALKICAKQIAEHSYLWTYPAKGHEKVTRTQLAKLVLNNNLMDAHERLRHRQSRLKALEVIVDAIIKDGLLKPMQCVGDKSKVTLGVTPDGQAFLAGTSLVEIRERQSSRQAEQARQVAARAKAIQTGHPSTYRPKPNLQKVGVGA